MAVPANLRCPICQGDTFKVRPGHGDEWSLSFFGLGGRKAHATEVVCRSCLFVMTFADPQ